MTQRKGPAGPAAAAAWEGEELDEGDVLQVNAPPPCRGLGMKTELRVLELHPLPKPLCRGL